MKAPGAANAGPARIGLVVPFDLALDREYWQYVPDDASVHITRTDYVDGSVSVALAEAVSDAAEVSRGTRAIVKVGPDVVGYACTSGSFVNGLAGERRLRDAILAAGAPRAITTSGAFLDALRALGIRRVALGTPYTEPVGRRLKAYVEEAGFVAVSLANLDLDEGIWDVAGDDVIRLAESAMRPDAEAVFLSCTNLPTISRIEELETRLGVPVLTANQVTMWAALREAGSPPSAAVRNQALFSRTGQVILQEQRAI